MPEVFKSLRYYPVIALSALTVGSLAIAGRSLAAPFTADLSHGEVTIKLEAAAERIDVARDFMITITVEAPAGMEVKLPDLRDRFSGFSLAEDYFTPPVQAGTRSRQVFRWRLEPEPAAIRYRLAPFPVTTVDNRTQPPATLSFATRPVLFPAPAPRPPVTGEPEVDPEPIWVPPTAGTISLWILSALAGAGVLAAAFYGLTHLSRHVRERSMTPVERAMLELKRLLGRDLPGRGLFKEFYIELTMVVRRYIERARGIRAPRQTTQEFLEAAARHPSFSAEDIANLKNFLESADMVKFAGVRATSEMAMNATDKARDYIARDNVREDPESSKVRGEPDGEETR